MNTEDNTEGSLACKKKKKSYCHYKSSWKTKIFSVEIAGNTTVFRGGVVMKRWRFQCYVIVILVVWLWA